MLIRLCLVLTIKVFACFISSAEPTPPDWANDTVLNVTGREHDLYIWLSYTKYDISAMTELMVIPQVCLL